MGEKSRNKKTCSNFELRFLCSEANKVVGDKDKVTLMSYEKCQRFAIAFFCYFCYAAASLKSKK
jgi:hypothetical protein